MVRLRLIKIPMSSRIWIGQIKIWMPLTGEYCVSRFCDRCFPAFRHFLLSSLFFKHDLFGRQTIIMFSVVFAAVKAEIVIAYEGPPITRAAAMRALVVRGAGLRTACPHMRWHYLTFPRPQNGFKLSTNMSPET